MFAEAEALKERGEENSEILLNYEQNMHDSISIMYKLQTGMDVNVKFSGVTEFEYTRECIVFDLLQIALYHGWLVDPQDEELVKAIDGSSYNQLVEKIITSKDGDTEEVHRGLLAEEFLNSTASQLTYHGLCELNSNIQEEELCVFFRNNHFSAVYKHKGELFLLVTDQGFLTEPNVIWETLSNIEGDGFFADAKFKTASLSNQPSPTANYGDGNDAVGTSYATRIQGLQSTDSTSEASPEPTQEVVADAPKETSQNRASENRLQQSFSQEDQDYLVALSLQNDLQQQEAMQEYKNTSETPSPTANPPQFEDDHQLALKLQREEEEEVARQEAAMLQQQQQQQQQQLQQQQQQQQRPVPG